MIYYIVLENVLGPLAIQNCKSINQRIVYHNIFKFTLFVLLSITGCLAATSFFVSLAISPAVFLFCRKKSTRLTAVVGGLVVTLGILFTSFAQNMPQLFFSHGTVIGKIYLIILLSVYYVAFLFTYLHTNINKMN